MKWKKELMRKGEVEGGKMFKTIFIAFLLILFPLKSFAAKVVTITEGVTTAVEVSSKDLNLIKFPFSGIKAYTKSENVDIKIHGADVFVSILKEFMTEPVSVFFATPHGTFSMLLMPKAIPSATIIVQVEKKDIEEALEWERSHDYVSGIKEFVKAMYRGVPPSGVKISKADMPPRRWGNILLEMKNVFLGASLKGEVYDVTNVSNAVVRLVERQFYEDGVLAVSIDKHELAPSEKTVLYIVKRTPANRKLMEAVEKNNPFQFLKY